MMELIFLAWFDRCVDWAGWVTFPQSMVQDIWFFIFRVVIISFSDRNHPKVLF